MVALTTDRRVDFIANTSNRYRVARVAGGALIYKGALIARTLAGFVVPAADELGLRVVGVAQEHVDNTAGVDGAFEVAYLTAASVKLKNDTASPVTQAELYAGVVYVADDQTVQAASSHGVVAGIAESLELDGTVFVFVAPEVTIGAEEVAAQVETVSAAAPLSTFARVSLLSPTGTVAMPLPAGRYIGQPKTIRMIGGTTTPIANVTGAFVTDTTAATQAQFNAAADQLDLVWTGAAWQVLNNVSVTLT